MVRNPSSSTRRKTACMCRKPFCFGAWGDPASAPPLAGQNRRSQIGFMDQSQYRPAPAADFVLPFDLPNLGMRGRFLRLDAVSTRALAAHPLPEGGQRILAEAMGLSALLGSALKFEGRLSVQTKGDGPLNLLVTDYFAGGGLRGYARIDERQFADAGRPSDFG